MPCDGSTLLGVLAQPGGIGAAADARHGIGVVIVVGGPQYRAGSHRLFVRLARRLADEGYPTLRFDARGMGDSTGEPRSFEQLDDDIRAAIGGLVERQPSVRRVVLWGLCDGASACLLYLDGTADPRVAGLCLLNPWVRSEQSKARTYIRHYYRARLLDPKVWLKALRGGLAPGAIRDAITALRRTISPSASGASTNCIAFQQRMARAWSDFHGKLLLLLSDNDYTAHEFMDTLHNAPDWKAAVKQRSPESLTLTGSDHTVSAQAAFEQAANAMHSWLQRQVAGS